MSSRLVVLAVGAAAMLFATGALAQEMGRQEARPTIPARRRSLRSATSSTRRCAWC